MLRRTLHNSSLSLEARGAFRRLEHVPSGIVEHDINIELGANKTSWQLTGCEDQFAKEPLDFELAGFRRTWGTPVQRAVPRHRKHDQKFVGSKDDSPRSEESPIGL
jgi:hypothetical protein